MRLLLDHCLDWRFERLLPDHEVITAEELRWDRALDQYLLPLVNEKKFDVFLTRDEGIPEQHNREKLAGYGFAIVQLAGSQKPLHFQKIADQLQSCVENAQPGQLYTVTAEQLEFPGKDVIDATNGLHANAMGGKCGVRDDSVFKDLAKEAEHLYYSTKEADLYDVAAFYLCRLAQAEPYQNANLETAADAAILFLEGNGVDTSRLQEEILFQAATSAYKNEITQAVVAEQLRTAVTREQSVPSPAREVAPQQVAQQQGPVQEIGGLER